MSVVSTSREGFEIRRNENMQNTINNGRDGIDNSNPQRKSVSFQKTSVADESFNPVNTSSPGLDESLLKQEVIESKIKKI